MSREHEALVRDVAKALIDADSTIFGYHETHIAVKTPGARAVLALIARTLEIVTPEMRDAIWDTRKTFEEAWRNTIAASPLSPGRQDAEKKDNADG